MYVYERWRGDGKSSNTIYCTFFVFERREKEEVVVVVVGVGRSYALAHTCRQNIRSAVRLGYVYALCAVSAYTRLFLFLFVLPFTFHCFLSFFNREAFIYMRLPHRIT